jgi:enamine deaminase RidA (YjgF/YER057c/UK114 family)
MSANGTNERLAELGLELPEPAAFGERGRHARMTVGVAALPYDVGVEVEGVFEVR